MPKFAAPLDREITTSRVDKSAVTRPNKRYNDFIDEKTVVEG